MAKWFERSPKVEREAAQERALSRFAAGLEKAVAARDRQLIAASPKPQRQTLPSPPTESIPEALARLARAGGPTTWSCPCRQQLLDLHLIERVTIDNLWTGDRLTEKGERELARSLTGKRP
jgi:hypothetical protein